MRRSRSFGISRPRSSTGTIVPVDDISTWSNSEILTTSLLPGIQTSQYMLVVDATKALSTTAASSAQSGSLRFIREDGVRLGHYRTASGRILLGGSFKGGVNRITAYWGKSGATQPGVGFPTATNVMEPFRLFLIFENGAPIDLSATPATFTAVGTPTYVTSLNGQGVQCAIGSYIQTTATKLTSGARTNRSDFVLAKLSSTGVDARLICWADWGSASQRAYQLWLRDVAELYVAENPAGPYNRWVLPTLPQAGWNAVGCKWNGGQDLSYILLNDEAIEIGRDYQSFLPAQLADANTPYIIGGSPVPGNGFSGVIDCQVSLLGDFTSTDQMLAWKTAWSNNDFFWNKNDYTPDNFDVPTLTNQSLNTEVAFAKVSITGISSNVPISVSSANNVGSPTYAIGSSMSNASDIKSKGSTDGFISSGQVLSSWHTTSALNSSLTETNVTIGTVTSKRVSSTISASPGGGEPTPGGPATYTVNSGSALKTAFSTANGGEIIEIAPGDYKIEGQIRLENRDFRGGPPLVIRSATLPWRGYLSTQGGLLVSGETSFTTGSGGSEFSQLYLRNIHNIEFIGLRTYTGDVGVTGAKSYTIDMIGCTYITLTNVKLCGFKPTTSKVVWGADLYRTNSGWYNQSRGMQMGTSSTCENITVRNSLIHYLGDIGIYLASTKNTTIDNCVFSDQMSDHLRSDGRNENFTVKNCILYRTWARKGSNGGISHSDHCQNTTGNQPGWYKHSFINTIFSPGDNQYPHIQCAFYECDNYPTYPRGSGLYLTNCLIEGRAPNAVYSRPGDDLKVVNCTIVQNQFSGMDGLNEVGLSLRDTTFNEPKITVSSTTSNGFSAGNNIIDSSVYYSHDLNTGLGDQIIGSTQFKNDKYNSDLFDYPLYSSSLFRPTILLNDSYVLSATALKRFSPKTTSSIHPNQMGRHHGASALLQTLGALA